MEQKQIDVLQWWYGTRDYQSGVMLYGRYGKNKTLGNTFNKPGKEKVLSGKLHYELCKSAGFNWKRMPLLPDGIVPKTINVLAQPTLIVSDLPAAPSDPGKRIPIITDVILLQYPKVIRRLKMEYQEAYQERSILHRKMSEVPEANTTSNQQTRADYLSEIKSLSLRMDYLYAFIANYENKKVVPLEEEVWPTNTGNVLPDDIASLKKIKKNLQSNNTKDNNLLLFQQKTKADKEKQMQPGPRRKRIELRIKKREADIEVIDLKILELEND
jgi:hypothetical protein